VRREVRLLGRKVTPVMEAIQTLKDAETMVDGRRGRWGLLIELKTNVVEEEGLVELGKGMLCLVEPARQVQQIIGVSAQGAGGELANALGIEKGVSPGELGSRLLH